jgi:hypothetical protein
MRQVFQSAPPVFRTIPELSHQLTRMIDLWPTIIAGGLSAQHPRHPTNVMLIYAFGSHAVELSKGVLALYRAGHAYSAPPHPRVHGGRCHRRMAVRDA